ncbi:MAG TPA: DUF6599 family protein [Terriglobales bacterium]|nr:DUF6599 family protein [Terriglobales bacterium]
MPLKRLQAALRIALLALPLLAPQANAQVTLVTPVKELPADGSLLPKAFSGWQKQPGMQIGTDPAKAGGTRAALLTESGMASFERSSYARQGRVLKVQVYRFNDATGAAAAFSSLRDDAMAPEKFCPLARSNGNHILLACTNLVLDLQYDKVTGMTPAEIRSLISQLPVATGTAALPPNAPLHLPQTGLSDVRFALGPAGLAQTGSPLPAEVIDFSKSPEVVVGTYSNDTGATLVTIVKYPTFALATERQKAFDSWHQSQVPTSAAGAKSPPSSGTFYTRRLGPLVAVVTGVASEAEARTLAEQVPYDVEVTQSEPVYTPKDNIGNLVVNMMYLSFIIVGFTFVGGLAFGGFRILARKYFPGRFVDRPEDVEFIKLDIGD